MWIDLIISTLLLPISGANASNNIPEDFPIFSVPGYMKDMGLLRDL